MNDKRQAEIAAADRTYLAGLTINELLNELDIRTKQAVFVKNSGLPKEWHDEVRKGRLLARLEQLVDKRDGQTPHQKRKATKAENIANYRKQFEENGEFVYNGHTDDIAQYRAECAMVQGMVNGGLIDADDLLED